MVSSAATLVAAVATAALALAPAALADPDHFILTEVNTLVHARIDPIINSAKVGSHMHNIMGASNFGTTLKHPDHTVGGAQCTTALVQDDKSSYWTPTLYYIHDNGTYEAMLAGARIYYFLKNPDKIQPWPKGMRIVSGTAMSRDENDIRSLGVDLTCGETEGTRHLPNGTSHDYCDSVHAGIYFPSCGWANQSLDSWDHFSHLTWPVERGGGKEWVQVNGWNCPDTHPIKYPTMFIQHFYRFDEHRPWRKGRNNVVFSNGDMLGTSFHGDFVNGWKDNVLDNVIGSCKSPRGPGEQIGQCAPLKQSLNVEAARNCAYQGMIPNEDAGIYRAIDKMPGCNPLWPANAGDDKPKCEGGSEPGWVKPNVAFMQGFLNRLPLYMPNVVPESLQWNWGGWLKSGPWGTYGDANSILKPNDQNAQSEVPSDAIGGSQLNSDGAVFLQNTPLDEPVILEGYYATFPPNVKGTPVVTYKGMPANVDVLGNPIVKPTGVPDLNAGEKQKAKDPQPTAPPAQFSEEDHSAAMGASVSSNAAASTPTASKSNTASSTSHSTGSTADSPAASKQDENGSWLDVPVAAEKPAASSAASAPPSNASASAGQSKAKQPKLGPNGKKCRTKPKYKGHKGHKAYRRKLFH